MKKTVSILFALFLVLGVCLMMAVPASAAANVTPAAGGGAISADTAAGAPGAAWTTLGAIVIAEGAAGDIAAGAFTLTIPAGFEFNVASAPDVAVTGATPQLTANSPAAITATTIQVTVTVASTTETDTMTIGGVTPIQVRPTAGTPLASGNITMTAGVIAGVNGATNFGTLTEVAGAATHLTFTQQPAGSVSGVALVTQPIVEAQDQFGNVDTTYGTNVVASENDPGALTGTTSIAPVLGVATFTDLVYTATVDHQIFQIDVTSGALTGATSNDVDCNVVAAKLVFTQQPGGSVSGAPLATQPIVAAQDAGNVTDADYVTNVVASEDDPGTLTGTLTVAPVAGVATFTDLVYTATADHEVFQIDVASGVLTGATSNDVVCATPQVGGGGALPATSGTGSVNLSPYLNGQGRTIRSISLTSNDGLVTISIPLETLVLDAQGNPLGSIQIIVLSTPPPPPGYVLVGHAYDCLPAGATFQPTMTLTFRYAETDIPSGVSEQDLVLAYWDGTEWVNLPTTINAANNTATAKVAHFTPFAILAYTGTAVFGTSDLSITPAEVDIGEEVTISTLVANTGDRAGSYMVTPKINDVALEAKSVTLDGGVSQKVTFTIAEDMPGTYVVSMDGMSRTFVVKEVAPVPPTSSPASPAPSTSPPAEVFNWWLVIGIIIGCIIVGVLISMAVRRR